MTCLNAAQIQAVADNEDDPGAGLRAHAATCARCRDRVAERRALVSAVSSAINVPVQVPDALAHRVQRTLAGRAPHGATRLRPGLAAGRRRWSPALWSTGALATATVLVVLFVAPVIKGPATVSASEILAKSADRLAKRVAAGVERLEYELTLEGVPREMMPDQAGGTYRVTQAIDHDTPGRYLAAAYSPAGRLVWGVAQDPAARRRVIDMLIDGRPYRFEFAVDPDVALSPPEMERLHMEASVSLMQGSGNQYLEIVDGPLGRQYRIDVPSVSVTKTNPLWDLTQARAIVDAQDYHIVELDVRGTFLRQPYRVSYKLITHTVVGQDGAPPGMFEMPADPDAVVLEGEGSAMPGSDVLLAALRGLATATGKR